MDKLVKYDEHGSYQIEKLDALAELVSGGFTSDLVGRHQSEDSNTICTDNSCGGSDAACGLNPVCIPINVTCPTDKFCAQILC